MVYSRNIFFQNSWFWKKVADNKKHEKLTSREKVKVLLKQFEIFFFEKVDFLKKNSRQQKNMKITQ